MPDILGPAKGFGVTFTAMFKKATRSSTPSTRSRPRPATTAGTS